MGIPPSGRRAAAFRARPALLVAAAAALAGLLVPPSPARAAGRYTVSVRTPASGSIAAVVVRFELARGEPAPAFELANRYDAPARTALVAGVTRSSTDRTTFTGIVAIVGFPSGRPAAEQGFAVARIEGNDPFVVEYQGTVSGGCKDARCGLAILEGAAGRTSWRTELALLPSTGVDPDYRSGRGLLDQVEHVLTGSPERSFLAALRSPGREGAPPAPSPTATPTGGSTSGAGLLATTSLIVQPDGTLTLRVLNTGTAAITSVALEGIDFTITSLAPGSSSECTIGQPGMVCDAGFSIAPGASAAFTIASYTCCLIGGEVWINDQAGPAGQVGPLTASMS